MASRLFPGQFQTELGRTKDRKCPARGPQERNHKPVSIHRGPESIELPLQITGDRSGTRRGVHDKSLPPKRRLSQSKSCGLSDGSPRVDSRVSEDPAGWLWEEDACTREVK